MEANLRNPSAQLLNGSVIGASAFRRSTQVLGLSGPDYKFLAYKAIGYLFINPIVAASILVASLRACEKAVD